MSSDPPVPPAQSSHSWFARVLWIGPDPPNPKRPGDASVWDTLLTWPVRLCMTAGALAVGLVWAKSPGGMQLGWALQYGILVAISVVTAFWLPLLFLNLTIALAWLGLSWFPPAAGHPSFVRRSVKWMNRQVSHIEAGATWVALALVFRPDLRWQLGGLAAVVLLGGPIVNGLARMDRFGGEEARERRVVLLRERRSLIYLATLIGLALLAMEDRHQFWTIFPLLLAILPGTGVRYLRFWSAKHGLLPTTPFRDDESAEREAARELEVAQATSWVAPTITLAIFCVIIAASVAQRRRLATDNASELDGTPPPADKCVPETGGPIEPTLAVLLLADTQIHDLGRERFPGQMEVVSALVPVSRRPVELDMLSTATVVRYQSVYEELERRRYALGLGPALWAHLGDFADLSCVDEMKRMTGLLATFAPGAKLLAGIAPGNHDSTFQGNFDWSPYWDRACQEQLDKATSDKALADLMTPLLATDAETKSVPDKRIAATLFQLSPRARYTITPLGTLTQRGRSRGVLGVFLDTSDRLANNFGIAGAFGSFSGQQRRQISAQIGLLRSGTRRTDAWADPWFVIFSHVPYDDLTSSSQKEFADLIATLDAKPSDCASGDCDEARVIGLVSAHTHVAESHRYCLAQRLVREIVVGSVIDPPEQAALLEIGLDAHARASLRLSTIPSIVREGFACPTAVTPVSAGACRGVIATLSASADCDELVSGTDADRQSASTCEELEHPLSLSDQIDGIARHGGPADPEELTLADVARARALLKCLCRSVPGDPAPPHDCPTVTAQPLVQEAYASIIEALARRPERQAELTCLGWAAAALQEHKANGMTMSDALRCAFDDPTLPAAQVTVASSSEVPCR